MRSAEELDAELTRTRRTVRRLMVGTTLGVAVGLGVIVTVVGATLAVVDKRAAELLTAPPHKASAPANTAPKVEQASKPADTPRATTAQAPAPTPPAMDTTAPRSAAVSPASPPAQATAANPPAQTTAANPPPAPRQSAPSAPAAAPQAPPAQAAAPSPPPQPARSQATATIETQPTPASPPAAQPAQPDEAKRIARGPRDAQDSQRAERDASRAVARRTHDETDGAAPRDADAARTETVVRDGDAPRVVIRGDDRAGRRVVRMPSADQDVAEPSERVTIIQRPGYGRTPPVAASESDGPRGGGLFGFIFGRHGDDD